MDNFFKKIGDDIAGAAEQAEIDAIAERELAASIAEIEEQAEEEVEITPEDPGLEIADAGQRPEEMRTQKEIRDYNRRVIEVSNAIKERNLEEGNKPTRSPEESSYGKRRRRRKYGSKKKKKAGKKKKRKTSVVKTVKRVARDVKKTVKKVGRGAKKIGKRVDRGANKVAKGLRSIFTEKRSFGRSATPMPTSIEDYEKVQGYDPRDIVMQSLFGKRKRKFGDKKDGCGCGFGKKRVYRFGKKCTSQCTGCGTITGFDPMAIVQKKLSYGKRRRKRKSSFGKKAKKPSAATRKMCKRLKVKMTLKRGGKRVYKSETMLKKQCKTAMKKWRKAAAKRRKRKSSFGKKAKKPSAALRKLCKKHKVRLTVKRGKKRVYKSEAMLKKQCKKAMKKKK
jgi:colicin import membrane protein